MKTKSIIRYVSFGRIINYLRFIRPGFVYHDNNGVKDNIGFLIREINELNLEVTSKISWLNELIAYKEELDKKPKDYSIETEDVHKITILVDKIKEVIRAELDGRIVFVITEKRLKVEKLLDNISDIFGLDVFKALPVLPQFDFTESGKCIAFERPTAGAFHILRGTEGILRWFYDKINSSSGCTDNWGNIINNMQQLSTPPPKEIMAGTVD